MLFTLPQFYFAFVNGFSAQTIYDNYYVTTYNLLFTAFTLGTKAVLEKDIDYKVRLPRKECTRDRVYVEDPKIKALMPSLYAENKLNLIFTLFNFLKAVLEGAVCAVGLFLFAIFAVNHHYVDSDGQPHDLWSMSIALYAAVIWVVTVKLCTTTRYWNIFFVLTLVFLTFAAFYAFTFVYNVFDSQNSSRTIGKDYDSFVYWSFVILFIGLQLLFDLSRVVLQQIYKPSSADKLRRQQKYQLKGKNKVADEPKPPVEKTREGPEGGSQLFPITKSTVSNKNPSDFVHVESHNGANGQQYPV